MSGRQFVGQHYLALGLDGSVTAVLDCDDEEIDENQRLKERLEELERLEFEEKVKQVMMRRKVHCTTRNSSDGGGHTILGISGPYHSPTRPPQLCRSLPSPESSILGSTFHGTAFRFPQVNFSPEPQISEDSLPPAIALTRAPINLGGVVRQNRPIQITSLTRCPAKAPPSSTSVQQQQSKPPRTGMVATKTSSLQSTFAGSALQSSQVWRMNQFQPLLFNANSGILLIPTTTQVDQMQGTTTTMNHWNDTTGIQKLTIPNRFIAPNIRSGGAPVITSVYSQRGSVQIRGNLSTTRPLIQTTNAVNVSSTVRKVSPPMQSVPRNTVITPKIIGSTTLQPWTVPSVNNKPERPTLTPALNPPTDAAPLLGAQLPSQTLPILRKGGSAPGMQAQSEKGQEVDVTKLTTRPFTPPAGTVETTSITNGKSEKDPSNSRTYPSLVVNVKPVLQKRLSKAHLLNARTELDERARTVLNYSASKFTEWLMQQGLLRLDHRCDIHVTTKDEPIAYKLGMYSDASKQPLSGGYVWIAECCPEKQISVFQGSIFESSIYQPRTIMKLVYHWSCQTFVSSVLQWVKITSFFLKNFYTLLRSCCVAALHEFSPLMGGNEKYVEVGIITLNSTMKQASSQKQSVKIEVLGVFDPHSKVIRMRILNPHNFAANSIPHPFSQILWPLKHWVDKNSCILIDSSIDKQLVLDMGFKTVLQTKSGWKPEDQTTGGPPSNVNVMNYLKNVVPKMFQNTLSVLSKSLIQQFLDELSWREIWGSSPASTFDTMVSHLGIMTKREMGESLISRLNKISLNPFGEWGHSNAQPTGIGARLDGISDTDISEPTLQQLNSGHSDQHQNPTSESKERQNGENYRVVPQQMTATAEKRKAIEMERQELFQYFNSSRKTIRLFNYYVNHCPSPDLPAAVLNEFPQNLKCPLCSTTFVSNLDIVPHVYSHVTSMGRPISQTNLLCAYCLKEFSNSTMSAHVENVHRLHHILYPCVICQERYPSQRLLTIHMWETHCRADMPHKCEICDYRSSCQPDVVDHFQNVHSGSDSVLCPLCLKVLSCKSVPCLKLIVVHVQSHTIRRGKKCAQCSLSFTNEEGHRAHLQGGAHREDSIPEGREIIPLSFARLTDFLMPIPPPVDRTRFALPPLKRAKMSGGSDMLSKVLKERPRLIPSPTLLNGLLRADALSGALSFHDFTFYLPPGEDEDEVYACAECPQSPSSVDRFPGELSCSKCGFNTSAHLLNLGTHNPAGVPKQEVTPLLLEELGLRRT